MTQSDKLKQLIESLKTSNEVMKKQIEIQNRTIDLLNNMLVPKSLPIEIPTHGGNDVPNIERVTDEQL